MNQRDVLKKGVFLDVDSVRPEDLDFSLLHQQLEQLDLMSISRLDEIKENISSYDVIITNKVFLDRLLLTQCKNLRLICVAATGTNNVDLQAARELGIRVCNVTAYATASVVQHVFALLLALQTRLVEIRDGVLQGEWMQSKYFSLLDYPVHELAGKTLGIVGYGELGQAVASVARAFGMQVLIARRNEHDDRPGRIDLKDLLSQVDVLSLHCPLTDETRDLIDEQALKSMKPTALIINTARGGIINEAALLNALEHRQIGGAGIDVLVNEPPVDNHPLLKQQLPNLIVTPHVAWASQESRQRLIDGVALNIKAFNEGTERNLV